MAAAASSGTRVRQNNVAAQRRRALKKGRDQVSKRISRKFVQYGDCIEQDQIPDFLAKVLLVHQSKLDPDGVQFVIDMSKSNNKESKSEGSDQISKEALKRAIEKYSEYILRKKEIDQIFKQFDKNRVGEMNRKELKRMLEAHERKVTRAVHGVVINLMVDDDDIDVILEESDIDKDGKIGPTEVLTAIAAWEQIVQLELKKREEQSCCIVL